MDEQSDNPVVRQLLQENRRLKDRLFHLEERTRQQDTAVRDATSASQVRKLLESKDQSLEQYAQDLERTVEELRRTNEQLRLWMAALRQHQDLIESDHCAIIGVNGDGRVILFNKAAVELLGERVRAAHTKPIEEIDFSKWDPDIPALVRGALQSGANASVTRGSVTASVSVLGIGADSRSALLRLSGLPKGAC